MGVLNVRCFQLQGGFAPWTPDQRLCPWIPLGALPPDPRYRLALARSPCDPTKPKSWIRLPHCKFLDPPLFCLTYTTVTACCMGYPLDWSGVFSLYRMPLRGLFSVYGVPSSSLLRASQPSLAAYSWAHPKARSGIPWNRGHPKFLAGIPRNFEELWVNF